MESIVWIEKNDFLDLKDVLLYSKTVVNQCIVSNIPYSRYRVILSNYCALNGLDLEDKAALTDYYTLSDLDASGNFFKFIKTCTKMEEASRTELCGCNPTRRKTIGHEKCYYCQRIEKDYTTPLKDIEDEEEEIKYKKG